MHLRGSALSIIPPSIPPPIKRFPFWIFSFPFRMSSNSDPTSSSHAAMNAPSKFTFRDHSTGRATNRKSERPSDGRASPPPEGITE